MLLRGDQPSPGLVEGTINFLASSITHMQQPNDEDVNVWGGSVISLPSVHNFRSRMRPIILTPDEMSGVTKTCRKIRASVKNVLRGGICVTLARTLGNVPGVRAATPYSLRRFTGASLREIINQISYVTREC